MRPEEEPEPGRIGGNGMREPGPPHGSPQFQQRVHSQDVMEQDVQEFLWICRWQEFQETKNEQRIKDKKGLANQSSHSQNSTRVFFFFKDNCCPFPGHLSLQR